MGLTKQQKQERRWKELREIAMAALRRISTEPEFSLLETSMDVFDEHPTGLRNHLDSPESYQIDVPGWHYGD